MMLLSIVKANEHYKVDSSVYVLQVPGFLSPRSLQQAQRSPGIREGEKWTHQRSSNISTNSAS